MSEDRLDALFQQLVELSAESRRERLEAIREHEPELHRELLGLLAAFEEAPEFLGAPEGRSNLEGPAARLGKYSIEREIGRGGMGIVYLARDPDLDRPVAIKILSRTALGRERIRKLRREARMLASVNHPHVAQVHSIEEVAAPRGGDTAILTMEYVPGTTLSQRLREGPLPPEQALDVGRQIAAALEAAHNRKIVHRDLKPQNIRVTPDGWVKVLDFGLAQVLATEQDAGSAGSSSGGTPGYMSPEQCRGEPIDHRSDIWSLGAVLYECLTGEPVVRGDGLAAVLEANRRGDVDLRGLPPTISQKIETLLRSCLEPDPADRSESASGARQILEEELLQKRAAALLGTPSRPSEPRSARRGNLPHLWSSFVGRAEHLSQIARALEDSRLVTVTGPGGVGKTRVAQELARRMESVFTGGVWFVDLSVIADGLELPATVARILRAGGVMQSGRADGTHLALIDAFHGERGLFVLDNCEHLITDVSRFVQELLAIPSSVSFLATSRQPLGLEGEWVVPLPPLEIPALSEDDVRLEEAESVRLFLDRARSRGRDFHGEGPERIAIAGICRKLDGLPLAIELAASHVRNFPLEEILRLIEAGRPLSAIGGALPDRHRSLHNLVDWSYVLLAAPEQKLLKRLSVFRGGCTLPAMEGVCAGWGGIETWQVYALLARLVERSLVEPEAGAHLASDPEVEPPPARYRLLETIRAYAADQLRADPEEAAALTDRFLAYMRGVAALRDEERTPVRSAWVRRVAPDYANLLHGLDLALSGGRLGSALALAEPLGNTWVQTGQWLDGLRWMDRILEARAQRGGIAEEDRAAEVRVLSLAALLAAIQGQADRARTIVGEALTLAEALGEPEPKAQALEAAGVAAWREGRIDEAQAYIAQCRRCFEEAEDLGGVAVAIGNQGILECTRGDLDSGRRCFEEYLRLARKMNDSLAEGAALGNLGWIFGTLGKIEEARTCFEQAIEIQRRNRDQPAVGAMLHTLAETLIRAGSTEEARLRLRESCRIRVRMGDRQSLMTSLILYSRLAEREERPVDAAEILAGLLRFVETGELSCRPDISESLRRSRDELTLRLGEDEMALAVRRGEARDIRGILAFADPDGFGPGVGERSSEP